MAIKGKIKLAKLFKGDLFTRDEICVNRMKHCSPQHTLHTAACIIASNPPSGVSILAEIFWFFTISLNLSASFVNGKMCLNPNVGKQMYGILLQKEDVKCSWNMIQHTMNGFNSLTAFPSMKMHFSKVPDSVTWLWVSLLRLFSSSPTQPFQIGHIS